MKLTVILCIICALVFFGAGLVQADDMSDLKAQIKALQETINAQQKTIDALNSKIQSIETKQQAQVAEVKKVGELEKSVKELKSRPAGLLEGATVGGHLKLYMLDQSYGKRNQDTQHNHLSAGINHLYLYFSKELSDFLRLEVQTDTSVSASATPAIGSDIARATTASTSTVVHQAFLTALLPQGLELKAGVFNPMFSEEYAKETWWHELYHQNQGLASLQSWHDTGVELYKNFDFDKWSLPVYATVVNGNAGSRYVDNNGSKTALFHIAPELFQTKLRLLGSLAFGKWGSREDDDSLRYVAGFDWKYKKFNLTSEYIYSKWDNLITTGSIAADGKREGYWVRALYNFTPKWKGLVKYSHTELYQTDLATMRSNNYDTTTLGLNFDLTPNSTIMSSYAFIDGDRSDGSESVDAQRYTLGWRTTF